MNTSYSQVRDPERKPDVHPFSYAEAPNAGRGAVAGAEAVQGSGFRSNLVDSQANREQAAQEAGRQAGEAQARAGFKAELQQVRDRVRQALDDFARERGAYYQQVERELVQLALSIARKILHREAQVDPLLLAGIVRVAIDQIDSNTKVAIRVHPQQGAEWREFFRHHPTPQPPPEIVEDPALAPDRCVLQTALGTAELGVEAQLKEIEQGLLDLMAQRPPVGV